MCVQLEFFIKNGLIQRRKCVSKSSTKDWQFFPECLTYFQTSFTRNLKHAGICFLSHKLLHICSFSNIGNTWIVFVYITCHCLDINTSICTKITPQHLLVTIDHLCWWEPSTTLLCSWKVALIVTIAMLEQLKFPNIWNMWQSNVWTWWYKVDIKVFHETQVWSWDARCFLVSIWDGIKSHLMCWNVSSTTF